MKRTRRPFQSHDARIPTETLALYEELVRTRRDLHQHPEPGFGETRTAAHVATRLEGLGIEVRTKVARTGVLGVLRGQRPGRTILVRADMDALPLTEVRGRAYGSQRKGYMHACGHDAHVAIALGAARRLAADRARMAGNVVFCFQPAEEGPGGALPMIEQGALDNPHVDACVGLHVWNDLPAGIVGVRHGPLMAASDRVEITLTGPGGHGAAPHQTSDLVVAAAHVITAVQTLRSRRTDPQDPVVVSLCAIQGGQAYNILPDRIAIQGTVRTFDPAVQAKIEVELVALVKGVARAFGARAKVDYKRGYPTTVNDRAFSDRVREDASLVVGENHVVEPRRTMGGEDMSYFLQRVPGCFFFLGTRNPDRKIESPHHSPAFDLEEEALPIGVEVLTGVVTRYLSENARA